MLIFFAMMSQVLTDGVVNTEPYKMQGRSVLIYTNTCFFPWFSSVFGAVMYGVSILGVMEHFFFFVFIFIMILLTFLRVSVFRHTLMLQQ